MANRKNAGRLNVARIGVTDYRCRFAYYARSIGLVSPEKMVRSGVSKDTYIK